MREKSLLFFQPFQAGDLVMHFLTACWFRNTCGFVLMLRTCQKNVYNFLFFNHFSQPNEGEKSPFFQPFRAGDLVMHFLTACWCRNLAATFNAADLPNTVYSKLKRKKKKMHTYTHTHTHTYTITHPVTSKHTIHLLSRDGDNINHGWLSHRIAGYRGYFWFFSLKFYQIPSHAMCTKLTSNANHHFTSITQ